MPLHHLKSIFVALDVWVRAHKMLIIKTSQSILTRLWYHLNSICIIKRLPIWIWIEQKENIREAAKMVRTAVQNPDDVGQHVVFGDKQYHLALCHTFRKVHFRCKSASIHLIPTNSRSRSLYLCFMFRCVSSTGRELNAQWTDIEILANFMGFSI